jgi:hypothetical protein
MATSRAQKAPSRRGHGNGRAKRITFGSGAGSRIQKVHYVVISARDRFGEGSEFCRLCLELEEHSSSSSGRHIRPMKEASLVSPADLVI